jgi:hypothetical protein
MYILLYSIYMDDNVIDSSKPAKKYPDQGKGKSYPNIGGKGKKTITPKRVNRPQKRG